MPSPLRKGRGGSVGSALQLTVHGEFLKLQSMRFRFMRSLSEKPFDGTSAFGSTQLPGLTSIQQHLPFPRLHDALRGIWNAPDPLQDSALS